MGSISFVLGGREHRTSREEIEERLAYERPKETDKYFVVINNRPFPPKQVVSAALGIPLSTFTTMAANAILARLGFEVMEDRDLRIEPKTESERLFELLLGSRGMPTFTHHPEIQGHSRKPDYLVITNSGDPLMPITLFFEVKEFQATPDDFKLGGGSFDPYEPIRKKIQDGLKNLAGLKTETCALVLFNAGKPFVDLRWQFIYAAMLGNLAFRFPINLEKGIAGPIEQTYVCQGSGEMIRYTKDGEPIEPYKTRISAVIALELFPVGKRRFNLAVKHREKQLRRELTFQEFITMSTEMHGTENDISMRELRVSTCLNPYAPLKFPADIFHGPYDEVYGPSEQHIQLLYAGEQLRKLEAEEKELDLVWPGS